MSTWSSSRCRDMSIRFELKNREDRKRAFKKLRGLILNDIVNGRIPTYHVLHIEEDGSADNHYMTPISLSPVDEGGTRAVWIQDFEFFLKLLLRLKRVVEVEYNPEEPSIVFTYIE